MKTIQAILEEKGYKLEDSGAIGKAFEIGVKEALSSESRYKKRVTPNNKNYDLWMRKGNLRGKIEIKSGCGELAIGKNLSIDEFFPRADYVIYSPEPIINKTVENQAFVFTRQEFVQMLKEYPKMVRAKKATSYYRNGYGTGATHERYTIQSFYSEGRLKASKKIRRHIDSHCTTDKLLKNFI